MRQLAACGACRRQYDVSKLEVGSRFRCRCGEIVRVAAVEAQDAAVVRCRSCGGPRDQEARSCRYCGADFTLHEQDLHTICPSCFARISDRARYCHHCATPIVPQERGGSPTDALCPSCGDEHHLHSRAMGGGDLSILECDRCAGIWLARAAFQAVVDRARAEEDAEPVPRAATAATVRSAGPGSKRLYRRCPLCSAWMHRKNYAKRSGVIIDTCADHGIWFDPQELDAILRWIRAGGQALADEREREEERLAAVRQRFKVEPKTDEGGGGFGGSSLAQGDLLGGLIRSLFDL